MRSYKLVKGIGDQDKGEGCWMSIGRWMVGEIGWADKVDCVSPIVRNLCIVINDILSDEDRLRLIGPRLLDPFGSHGSNSLELERIWAFTSLVCAYFPAYATSMNGRHFAHIASLYTDAHTIADRTVIFMSSSLNDYTTMSVAEVESFWLPLMYDLIAMGDKTPVKQVNACKLECAV